MFSGSRGDDQVPKHEKLQNRMNASEGSLGAVGNDTVSITKPQTNNQGELQCQYDDVIQDSRKCPRQVHDLVFILLPKLVQGSGRMFSGTLDRELSSHGVFSIAGAQCLHLTPSTVGNEPFNGGSDGHSDNHIRDKSPGENKPSARDESHLVRALGNSSRLRSLGLSRNIIASTPFTSRSRTLRPST
jgi:hypothetical protein